METRREEDTLDGYQFHGDDASTEGVIVDQQYGLRADRGARFRALSEVSRRQSRSRGQRVARGG